MLSLAVWAFVLAYGRMTRKIGPLPFIVLAGVAAVVTYLSASLYPDYSWALQFAINLTAFALAFFLGNLAGRWLDRDKYDD
jgi:hypothetical protein